MKNWKCSICTSIYDGDNPPEVCPYCGTPQEQFIPTDEDVSARPPRAAG